jgi:hypothetical protein
MNPQARLRLLVGVTAALAALFLGDRLVLTPLSQSWKARSAEIQSLRKRVNDGQNLLDRESSLRDRWATMRRQSLPSEPSQAESQLLQAFDRWSRESGVGISGIRPQWKRTLQRTPSLECRADAFGSLSDLTRFLYLMEQDPLPLRLDRVEFAARDAAGSQLTLGIQLTGLILETTQP